MRLFFIIAILTSLTSCETQLTFDSKKWKDYRDLEQYPFRESMLQDIVENKRLIGLKYQTVIDSLGQPENNVYNKDNELWYPVTVQYGTDIDPVYTKHLTLTMNKDSAVERVEIREWRKE